MQHSGGGLSMMRLAHGHVDDGIIDRPPLEYARRRGGLSMMRLAHGRVADRIIDMPFGGSRPKKVKREACQ